MENPALTFDDLKKAKAKLEDDILKMVNNRVRVFQRETGFSPDDVYISMEKSYRVNHSSNYFTVTGCSTTIAF